MNRNTMANNASDTFSPYDTNRPAPSVGSHARQGSSGGISISPQLSPRPSGNLQRHASTVSAESQQSYGWQPIMGQFGPSDAQSPPLVNQQVWSDGGDLGHGLYDDHHQHMAPPEPNYFYQNQHQPYTQPHPQPELPHQPLTRSFSSRRQPPEPFQLGNAALENNPTPPVSSARSFFSPRGGRFFGNGRSDSGHNLLTASTTPNTPWRASPAPPPYSPVPPAQKKWWQWRASYIMYIFFLFGLLCAIGHHILYATLHGKVADRQVEMLRYGAALAFLAKAGFITSVIVAYRQVVWTVVRKKLMSLGAIDSLFAATEDLSALWNVEMYKKATAATLMALLVWLTPLVIIFTGSTLGTAQYHNQINTTCPGVRTLNFTKESVESWRTPTKIDNMFAQSVNLYNKTANEGSPQWETDGFDYWTDSSQPIIQTARMAAYSKDTLGRVGAAEEICSQGWNCSYVFNFTGPGYDCQEQASGVGTTLGNFGKHKPPRGFDMSLLLPEGNHSYYVFATGGDYSKTQWPNVWPGGIPRPQEPPYPEDLGSFRTEPIIWVGYVERTPEFLDQLPKTRDDPNWDAAFVPKIFACEHKMTEYVVRFHHTSEAGRQTHEILSRNFLNPVIDTAWVQPGTEVDDSGDNGNGNTNNKIRRRAQDEEGGKNESGANNKTGNDQKDKAEDDDGNENNDSDSDFDPISHTADKTLARPHSNYVPARAPNVEHYKLVAAYHSIGSQLRGFVNGTVDSAKPHTPIANTEALATKLLDPRRESFPYGNLRDRLQGMYEDMLLSMFRRPEFVSVVWAARPDEVSGDLAIPPADEKHSQKRGESLTARAEDEEDKGEGGQALRDRTAYPCIRSRNEVRYDYYRRDLWIVYTIAVVLTIACLVVGTMAVLEGEGKTGALRDTRFSTILAATRGPSLEKLGLLGGGEEELPPDIRKMKLGYGVVNHAPGGGGGASRPGSTFEGGVGGLGVLHEEEYNQLDQTDTRYNPMSSPPPPHQDQGGRIWDANSGQYVGFGLEGDVLQRRKNAFRRSVMNS